MKRVIPGLIWLILWTLSWLPGFILRFFSKILNAFINSFFGYRQKVVATNLKNSFPHLTDTQRQRVAEQFYQHFSDLFLEMVLFTRLSPHRCTRHIQLENSGLLIDRFKDRQNIIVMAGHFGNWEWNLLPILATGYRVIAVYKPQMNELAGILMEKIRSKPGIMLVPMKETMRVISRELNNGDKPFALLLVADQIPAKVDIRYWTNFLHQDTAFFTGGEKLALRFNMPVFYMDQRKLAFGRYHAQVQPLFDGSPPATNGEITMKYAAMLEESILGHPHLWLWTHRRWKYPRERLPLQA